MILVLLLLTADDFSWLSQYLQHRSSAAELAVDFAVTRETGRSRPGVTVYCVLSHLKKCKLENQIKIVCRGDMRCWPCIMSSRLHLDEESEKEALMMDPEAGGGSSSAKSSSSRRQSSSSSSSQGNPDFMLIKIVARIALSLIRWAAHISSIKPATDTNIVTSGGSGPSPALRCWRWFSSTGCMGGYSHCAWWCSASRAYSTRRGTSCSIIPTSRPRAGCLSPRRQCLIFPSIISLYHPGKGQEVKLQDVSINSFRKAHLCKNIFHLQGWDTIALISGQAARWAE